MAEVSRTSVLAGVAPLDQETKKQVMAHAADPIRFGMTRLPGGILDGKAKLVECGFRIRKADSEAKQYDGHNETSAVGLPYFYAAGVIFWPESVPQPDGTMIKVSGEQTHVDIPYYPNKRGSKLATKWDNILRIMNELKLLTDNERLFLNPDSSPKDITNQLLEDTAAAVLNLSIGKKADGTPQRGVFFKFTTEAGKPQPGRRPTVFENWKGSRGLKDWSPPSAAAKVQDRNVAAPQTQVQPVAQLPASVPQPAAEPSLEQQIAALIERAQNGDETDPATGAAQQRLFDMALANGHDRAGLEWDGASQLPPGIVGCKDWHDIGQRALHPAKQPAVNGTAMPSTNGSWPTQGDLVRFVKAPLFDARTKQPMPGKFRKAEATVETVHGDGTFDLLDFGDRKTQYAKVATADLEPV